MNPTLSYPGQFWCNTCEEYNCDHIEYHIRYWNEYYDDDGSNRNHYLHNENGPAYISDSGNKFYYIEDQLHRIDQPAIEYADGTYEYYQQGFLHNPNGPAIFDGKNYEYWLCGTQFQDLTIVEQYLNDKLLKNNI